MTLRRRLKVWSWIWRGPVSVEGTRRLDLILNQEAWTAEGEGVLMIVKIRIGKNQLECTSNWETKRSRDYSEKFCGEEDPQLVAPIIWCAPDDLQKGIFWKMNWSYNTFSTTSPLHHYLSTNYENCLSQEIPRFIKFIHRRKFLSSSASFVFNSHTGGNQWQIHHIGWSQSCRNTCTLGIWEEEGVIERGVIKRGKSELLEREGTIGNESVVRK